MSIFIPKSKKILNKLYCFNSIYIIIDLFYQNKLNFNILCDFLFESKHKRRVNYLNIMKI
jgi:hypothetical protein